MKEIDYQEIINRIGFFRNKANLSMRETSARLGKNPQFMKTIENKSVELKVSTLLEFCEVVDIKPQDFFYMGTQYNKEDKEVLELYSNLTDSNKQTILDLMRKLK
ncbi:MAG: helix-turn-helix transcriptional regulator [Clostridiales bacterium]|nr:helix-turn-helix transcriptional regulator [Clostridiales bacterium]